MEDLMINYIIENNLSKLIDIINNGANIHYKDEYPLILAASKGYLSIVISIISIYNPNINAQNGMALKNACVFGHINVVMCLIENGADVNIDDGSALVWSLYKSHYDITKYLIKNGANVNIRHELPLKICIEKGNLEMVKYLIENDANVFSNFLNEKYLKNLIENGKGSIVIYLQGIRNQK